MSKNRALRGCIIIVLLIVVLCFLSMSNVVAQESGGPKTISGIVYNADGKDPEKTLTGKYDGTYAAVIVEHKGSKTTYKDPNGLEQDADGHYWYAVTIPEGAWKEDDTYWIWVDGSAWGDEDFTCSGHGDPGVNSWKMDASGSEWRNVDTADYNFKPLIAWIFAIILGVIGIVIGIFRPLKIPASGWPRQPADLTDDILIVGTAQVPEGAAAPAAGAPAEEEKRICETCGGAFEYIPEYDKWYCYTCKKYMKEAPSGPETQAPIKESATPPETPPETPPGTGTPPPGGA